MWKLFKRIRCQCTNCERVWYIPRRRILRFERFFDIRKGRRFVWECHACHEGLVVPGFYVNIHGEEVKIDLKTLDSDVGIIRF
jgi:hypothetical protein